VLTNWALEFNGSSAFTFEEAFAKRKKQIKHQLLLQIRSLATSLWDVAIERGDGCLKPLGSGYQECQLG
jgi:hypothetical protein